MLGSGSVVLGDDAQPCYTQRSPSSTPSQMTGFGESDNTGTVQTKGALNPPMVGPHLGPAAIWGRK